MKFRVCGFVRRGLQAMLVFGATGLPAQTFRVATYNLENYLDAPTETRPHPKSAESRAKVRESIRALRPDVIALQEMGRVSALEELRAALRAEGLDFPHWEHVSGFDTNIHVAILSRFPLAARRPHTNEGFLLGGRRFQVSRGIAEVDVNVHPRYSFTLITTHLKSRRPVPEADEADLRLAEARKVREIIDARLAADPRANLVVAGDFNDTKDSPAIRMLLGRGKRKLVDTRPAERNGDRARDSDSGLDPRTITWTHYYGKEDTYSRIDYLMVSPGMAKEWVPQGTCVLALPDWGIASDHRPLVAEFEAADR
jgi:endonuclease/exonuclease/phosphatase family metal-dependent hydrolase